MNLLKNNRGATAVEFALVALPVLMLIFGIMQTGYIVWIDNLLHISVNTAARCGAISTSTTLPCYGPGLANMTTTANLIFHPIPFGVSATFSNNSTCSGDGGSGLIGTYPVNFRLFRLTLTAKSCYPSVP